MRAKNAGIYKTPLANAQTYAKQSADQAAIDEYIAQHGTREAVNTGIVFSFNGNSGRKKRVGHGIKK